MNGRNEVQDLGYKINSLLKDDQRIDFSKDGYYGLMGTLYEIGYNGGKSSEGWNPQRESHVPNLKLAKYVVESSNGLEMTDLGGQAIAIYLAAKEHKLMDLDPTIVRKYEIPDIMNF